MTDGKTVSQPRVGFVGLGDIGEPMACRIIEAGFPVTLWARREASLRPFEGTSFRRAETLAELGRDSEVVGVCVFGEDDVSEVVLGEGGILSGMAAGGVIMVHSTVSVEFVVDLAHRCASHGVTVMDIPISGFRARAVSGELTVMAGGPAATFEAVRPVLDTFGTHVVRLGPIGSGLKMKALNQALLGANFTSAALALHTGRRLGLDRAATETVLSSASGGSFGLDLLVGRILPDPQFAELAYKILLKDLGVFEAICRAADVDAAELRLFAAQAVALITGLQEGR
ncbi:NAD(P)-dependent oxidoreductase [Actinoallomurus soli]|uniref:NAD(P)-dependent oxidoreductase n=1 Tax=Actinoallomurus soli TaxID=2952535 RepID=UPI0020924D9F|nr:NAD(P)-dependent oxidoreductase [Actinoallomurus soli]MCO5967785.1 NAD(P)-dependent oxidoreductase [Actinoallomurus soli]